MLSFLQKSVLRSPEPIKLLSVYVFCYCFGCMDPRLAQKPQDWFFKNVYKTCILGRNESTKIYFQKWIILVKTELWDPSISNRPVDLRGRGGGIYPPNIGSGYTQDKTEFWSSVKKLEGQKIKNWADAARIWTMLS